MLLNDPFLLQLKSQTDVFAYCFFGDLKWIGGFILDRILES
jgi:hypothetical protein